jgi:hypothetical protein
MLATVSIESSNVNQIPYVWEKFKNTPRQILVPSYLKGNVR